jgi:hypothetical protein
MGVGELRMSGIDAAEERWRRALSGGDPFDALAGTRVPRALLHGARARQAIIQLRKRCPVDLGPMLGVKPFVMAKTAGAFVTACARRTVDAATREDLDALRRILPTTEGCLGDGRWGYEFDVQTRWAYYPKGSPNLIATFFVARGAGEAGCALGEDDWLRMLHESAAYLSRELYEPGGGESYFRYVPESSTLVHNANLLGAGLVAASAALRGDVGLVESARVAALTSVAAQDAGGGWPYGVGESLRWQDSFHTAYNLDGLLLVWLATGDALIEASLRRGAADWRDNFFGPQGEPWYGPSATFPLDIHSAGTAMDVAARLASWGFLEPALAALVAAWTEANLVDPVSGAVWFRRNRASVDRRHFPRWNDAHLALGRASVELTQAGRLAPLESAVRDARVRLQKEGSA